MIVVVEACGAAWVSPPDVASVEVVAGGIAVGSTVVDGVGVEGVLVVEVWGAGRVGAVVAAESGGGPAGEVVVLATVASARAGRAARRDAPIVTTTAMPYAVARLWLWGVFTK
jgi:hypothetical protein